MTLKVELQYKLEITLSVGLRWPKLALLPQSWFFLLKKDGAKAYCMEMKTTQLNQKQVVSVLVLHLIFDWLAVKCCFVA